MRGFSFVPHILQHCWLPWMKVGISIHAGSEIELSKCVGPTHLTESSTPFPVSAGGRWLAAMSFKCANECIFLKGPIRRDHHVDHIRWHDPAADTQWRPLTKLKPAG